MTIEKGLSDVATAMWKRPRVTVNKLKIWFMVLNGVLTSKLMDINYDIINYFGEGGLI
jgi:hypothetical protein